ncbi:MAG: polyphosphate kinase 1, partial [Bacteroidota bacterium]
MELYDRDLSWLSFNYRVLMEGMDKSVPLLERLRFLAIYSSNLDEFFRVRVADIRNIAGIDKKKINEKIDFNPQELLDRIHEEVSHQLSEYGTSLDEVINGLKEKDLIICTSLEEIPAEALPSISTYFKTRVSAFLKPVILNEGEDLFLDNQALYFAIAFESGMHACLNIPSDKLPRFFKTKTGKSTYFIFLDDVIRLHLDLVFPKETISDCRCIKLNKNADLQIDDEYEGDLVAKIENQIQKRNLGIPSRFLFDMNIDGELLSNLARKLKLSEEDMVSGGRYHNLNDFFQISSNSAEIEYLEKPHILSEEVENSRSLFKLIEKKDLLFHFPYHSYDYILQFFNEAALDPNVLEIN